MGKKCNKKILHECSKGIWDGRFHFTRPSVEQDKEQCKYCYDIIGNNPVIHLRCHMKHVWASEPKTEEPKKCGKWDCKKNHNYLGQHWEELIKPVIEPQSECKQTTPLSIHSEKDVNKVCQPSQERVKDWETRFLSKFGYYTDTDEKELATDIPYKALKDFISSELLKARKEERELIKEKIKTQWQDGDPTISARDALGELLDELGEESDSGGEK